MIKYLTLITFFTILNSYASDTLKCTATLSYEIVTDESLNIDKEAGSAEYQVDGENFTATYSDGFNIFNEENMYAGDLLVKLDIFKKEELLITAIDVSSGFYHMFSTGETPVSKEYGLYYKFSTSNTPNSSEKLTIECYLE